MKYKTLILHLLILLTLNFSYSKKIIRKETNVMNVSYNNNTVTCNVYCLNDYDNSCDILMINVKQSMDLYEQAYTLLSPAIANKILDHNLKYDIIIDDFSKLHLKSKFNEPFVTINTNFEPIMESMKEKFDKYPNYKTLEKKFIKIMIRKISILLLF
ncbi:hypothetical protein BCR32DRAFT_251779 [Anaeromyces robustus]|uniref:Uncharacterized protein n=1 Tax=Anaeromyces robustus TaxID=1754192 RepID=A0A1Y1VHA6_9FUNG|nr:hypothetical protein BCR32DRAFT_251779 [Anaeromyces robustus]|eukprot:ORX55831.1 hypothetical protein BCR32DRAFT_251779 [Anaeromyces robustus]